jgi:hypothetical protein
VSRRIERGSALYKRALRFRFSVTVGAEEEPRRAGLSISRKWRAGPSSPVPALHQDDCNSDHDAHDKHYDRQLREPDRNRLFNQ